MNKLSVLSDKVFIWLAYHGFLDFLPDTIYLKRMFRAKMGYKLNLQNPKTFSEKLQWLKLYDRKPEYCEMVDKYAAKAFVSEKIGEQYIVPTLGVWNHFDEIDFNQLPDQFVLKCTHDSGGLVICRDKSALDRAAAKEKIEKSLKKNYFYLGREWPYKSVSPRIIAEQYLEEEPGCEIYDYKVMCFNGEPKLIEFHQGRYTDHQTQDFYDTSWNKTQISQAGVAKYQVSSKVYPRPQNLDKMLMLSKELARGLPQIRVDWYSIKEALYFGELTFFDGSGLDPFDNPDDDLMLGNWISLPFKKV